MLLPIITKAKRSRIIKNFPASLLYVIKNIDKKISNPKAAYLTIF